MGLVKIRNGVSFNEPAAKSIVRMESQLGREIPHNRTTVPYAEQKKLYEEWKRGEHPDIPVVLNPDYSIHVYRDWDSASALASDSNDDDAPWEDNGWRIVNRDELWHREYQYQHDNHINDVTIPEEFNMSTIEVITCPAYEAASQRVLTNGSACMVVPAGWTIEHIQKGITFRVYDTNQAFLNEVAFTWQLNGLSLAEVQKNLVKITKDIEGIEPTDLKKIEVL